MEDSSYTKTADCSQIARNGADYRHPENICNVPCQKYNTRYYRKPETFFAGDFAFVNEYYVHCNETKYNPSLYYKKEKSIAVILSE